MPQLAKTGGLIRSFVGSRAKNGIEVLHLFLSHDFLAVMGILWKNVFTCIK